MEHQWACSGFVQLQIIRTLQDLCLSSLLNSQLIRGDSKRYLSGSFDWKGRFVVCCMFVFNDIWSCFAHVVSTRGLYRDCISTELDNGNLPQKPFPTSLGFRQKCKDVKCKIQQPLIGWRLVLQLETAYNYITLFYFKLICCQNQRL